MSKIVVAGIPRSGTTYINRHLNAAEVATLKAHSFAPPYINPKEPRSQKVMEWLYDQNSKAIFLFSNPIIATISTMRMKEHYQVPWKDSTVADHDGWEQMFDTWMRPNDYPVLTMRYETMFQHLAIVEHFVEKKVEWSPYKPRRTTYESIPPEQIETAKKTYHSLIEKINEAPDVAIWGIRR